jgi:hypothetical protein
MDTPGHGIWLTVSSPEGGAASDNPLGRVPRRLHLAFEGIPDAEAEALRQRLAVDENQTLDPEALHKELARIHQIIAEFDPHLNANRMRSKVPRNMGADGKPLIPDVIGVTLVISPGNANAPMEQYVRTRRAPSSEEKLLKLFLQIRGLSAEATTDLRNRLKITDGQIVDAATLRQIVAHVRAVLQNFTPTLVQEMLLDMAGTPDPPEPVTTTILIQPSQTIKP